MSLLPALPRPELVARLHAAGCVFAEDEARLLAAAARSPTHLATLVDQRAHGQPLEHLLGWAEFCGLRITVDPGVFVPRRRTEFLVRQALDHAQHLTTPVVVDLCCGTGAVATALAASLRPGGLHAVDIDLTAVRCARRNLPEESHVHHGDLYTPLPPPLRGEINLLLVNAPYVPTDAIPLLPPEARLHEPRDALDGGHDGLDIHRRIATDAHSWLAPGGHLLVETSANQAPHTADLLAHGGLHARVAHCDELNATVVVGTKPH